MNEILKDPKIRPLLALTFRVPASRVLHVLSHCQTCENLIYRETAVNKDNIPFCGRVFTCCGGGPSGIPGPSVEAVTEWFNASCKCPMEKFGSELEPPAFPEVPKPAPSLSET